MSRSEQVKRKFPRGATAAAKAQSDNEDEDEDEYLLISFEEDKGVKEFSIVKKSEVKLLPESLDIGTIINKNKSHVVEIIKRGEFSSNRNFSILIFYWIIKLPENPEINVCNSYFGANTLVPSFNEYLKTMHRVPAPNSTMFFKFSLWSGYSLHERPLGVKNKEPFSNL